MLFAIPARRPLRVLHNSAVHVSAKVVLSYAFPRHELSHFSLDRLTALLAPAR